jgi:hypothetical protein
MTESREFWTLVEPYHALTYFAPQAAAAFEDIGLRGFWRGYFAGRAAPMGPVGAGVITRMLLRLSAGLCRSSPTRNLGDGGPFRRRRGASGRHRPSRAAALP